jgi:pyruvate dehydrogenase E1 component alpha subunit
MREAQAGRVPGSTHLYAGQEAVAVGVCMALTDRDWIASTIAATATASPRAATRAR